MPTKFPNMPLMKFRLNVGQHCGNKYPDDERPRVFNQGDIIETVSHLSKRFGDDKFTRVSDSEPASEGYPMVIEEDTLKGINDPSPNEFIERARSNYDAQEAQRKVQEQERIAYDPNENNTLEGMTIEELTKLALEEEISLGSAKTKKDIMRKINEHTHAVAQTGQQG